MIQRVLRLLQRRAPAAVSHTIEPPTAVDLVLFTGQTRAGMVREFAVWCAKRVWNLVGDRSYDYDPSAHARFVSAVDTAERFARGRVSEDELRVVYHASVDPRCAKTGWGPGRLANVGAFRDAALMSARFACRSTCEADATRAAR